MNNERSFSPIVTFLFILVSLSVTLLAIRVAREIISPIILAFVLGITMSPLVNWLKRKGLPDMLSYILTILIIAIGILAIVLLISTSVQDFTQSIPTYRQNMARIQQSVDEILDVVGLDIEGLTANDKLVTPESTMSLAASFASDLMTRMSTWVLIIVTSTYFLLESTIMPQKIEDILAESHPDVQRFLRFNQDLRQFMSITAVGGFIIAALQTILLLIIGVDFAVLWGIFAFFMSFVPQVGIILALIPPAIMALVQFGVTEMLIVIAGYFIIYQIVEILLKRPFMQKKLNVSMLVIFISLILWGWVLGPIGAVLSVPMALMIKAILDSREETRWMAYLMSDRQEPYDPMVVDE